MRLNELQWTSFLRSLNKGNCCLVIGPDIKCIAGNGPAESVLSKFSSYLKSQMEELAIDHDANEHDFYYRADRYRRRYLPSSNDFHEDITAFVHNHLTDVPQIYQNLARLPFRTVCSLIPDPFFSLALHGLGFHFVEDHYDYKLKREPPKVDNETQLLYYMYGKYTNPESVATTPEEHLELVKNIVSSDPPVPDNVRSRFQKVPVSFLFLGFDFNDWHFRLVLKSIGIRKLSESYFPEVGNSQIAFIAREYYTGNMGITFLSDETESFVQECVSRYEVLNGAADRLIRIFIDYHPQDVEIFNELSRHLKINCGDRKFKIVHPLYQEVGEAFDPDDEFKLADVYIPMISAELFLACQDRIQEANRNRKIKLIIINTREVEFEAIFGGDTNRPEVLPNKAEPLYGRPDLTKLCGQIAKTLNAIIR